MGRSVTSCRVVRPVPAPREIQALNRRLVMTAGAWAESVDSAGGASSAAPADAANAPRFSNPRRERRRVLVLMAISCEPIDGTASALAELPNEPTQARVPSG
jgi:hypothetical protein